MRKWSAIIATAVISIAAVFLLGAAGWYLLLAMFYPSPIPAPGWTCDSANCTPNGGTWQELRVGMSHADAFRAVCGMWKRGVIAQPTTEEEREDITPSTLPVHMEGQECKPNPYELSLKPADRMADTYAPMDLWHLFTPNMWCSLHLSHQRVWVEFGKDLRVRSILSSCHKLII